MFNGELDPQPISNIFDFFSNSDKNFFLLWSFSKGLENNLLFLYFIMLNIIDKKGKNTIQYNSLNIG